MAKGSPNEWTQLYFVMSTGNPYQVVLMTTSLSVDVLASATLLALLKVGIDFSVEEAELRQWLNNREFTPYPALAEALLELLEGKRLRQPVYIDVIRFKYEDVLGASSPRSVADVDFALLRAAVLESYNERYGEAVSDFQSLVR